MEGTDGLNGVLVIRDSNSRSKFKIITASSTLYLKADSKSERDKWVQAILNETSVAYPSSILKGGSQNNSADMMELDIEEDEGSPERFNS